ncbi:hypothetical protein FPZ54_11595 [Sphingomonas suaedae]|uniref:Uncharacterized protein n=2 Tax=Sphingomonas suaedae TaxID=2599297 RepID=A0A518RGL5_9SPHN|nr:hypothetical protein FPZ54_11595 [Sphingomonas suaedae]
MFRTRIVLLSAAFCAASPHMLTPVAAQRIAESGVVVPRYAEVADLVLGSPVVVDGQIRSAARIKGAEAADVAPGHVRYYVEADVLALIRAGSPMPARIGYVVDVPLDARGRAPRLNKRRVLAFARPVAGRPTMVQLTTLDSQRDWSAELDAMVRRIVREVVAPDAPPAVTGLGNAFHVPGTLPGEGETQIFVQTATGDPISLSILRRPGQDRRWSVSLGEIVDEGAGPPPRDTLLWYRLACGLPRTLPAESLSAEDPENARVAREDYRFVLDQLGNCRG